MRLKKLFTVVDEISTPVVELLAYTPEPEKLVAVAARRCYDKRPTKQIWEDLTETEIACLLHEVIRHGHLSVLEHVYFTFAIEGISRALSHQLVRHRIASYSQQSQQRVDETDYKFVMPPKIKKNAQLARQFREITQTLNYFYASALESGVPKGQARYLLPSACTTKIVMTMNARSLFNLISQRTCCLEEWEFRTVAFKMFQVLLEIAPNIFSHAGPKCIVDLICPEGKKGEKCGLYKKIPGAVLRDGFDVEASKQLFSSSQTGVSIVDQLQADKRNHPKKTSSI